MNIDDDLPILVLPTELDDDAAVQLLDFFLEAARVLENHYAAQLRRHHQHHDDRQHRLFNDRDPPF